MKFVFNPVTSKLDYVASVPGDVGATTNHAELTNLDYANAGHTGFQAALAFPLAANLGGTGIANAAGSTLTLGGATTISTGGTIALGGYTLTVPATGTAALLATANVFTATQTITPASGNALALNGDVFTDRWLAQNTNTAFGIGVFGAGTLAHTTGATGYNNTAIGNGCLFSATTASWNVGIGVNALYFTQNGYENMAIGTNALLYNTSGFGNVAIGTNAMFYNVTGQDNVAIGWKSGAGASTKSFNYSTFIGSNSGNAIQTGNSNTFIGYNAGAKVTTTSSNTAIGSSALASAVTGSNNTVVGLQAGTAATSSFNVMIGTYAGNGVTSGASCVFLGYAAGARQTTTSNLFIVGNTLYATAALEQENSYLYGSMAAGGYLQLNIPTTTNNAVQNTLKLQAYVSTASTGAAAGFGVGLPFLAETATDGTYQQQGLISTSWIDATNVSRKAKMSLSAYDTAARLGLEIEADGSAAKIGLYGVATVARATTGVAEAAFTENAGGTAVNVDSTFGGYTLQQIAQALQNIGILT